MAFFCMVGASLPLGGREGEACIWLWSLVNSNVLASNSHLLVIHPSGFAVEYHPSVTDYLTPGNGGKKNYTNKRSRRARFYDVMQCLGQQRGIASFWTFTIPKQQTNYRKTDGWFTSRFSMLLESLRLRYKRNQEHGLRDYVWVSEAQKRGNIHFHIVTSSPYIDARFVRKRWTALIEQYSPNCVDVEVIKNYGEIINVSAYFAKYMGADHKKKLKWMKIPVKSKNYIKKIASSTPSRSAIREILRFCDRL